LDKIIGEMKTRVRASAICLHQGKLLLVRQKDPGSGREYLFPPGGVIEKGEPPNLAAERETLEETGYRVKVAPETELVARYDFHWANGVYDVTTHFFRAALLSPDAVKATHSDETLSVEWIPVTRAIGEFEFHRELDTAIRALIFEPE
jgi:8-oxo-dGTP pyrophosphatase MutT (NUDIX family)